MLIYVLIHEIAHHVTVSIGHTPEFHEKFQLLLKKAEELKIYDSTIPVVKNYCMK
jgi:predicted metal-dependent hydrolase